MGEEKMEPATPGAAAPKIFVFNNGGAPRFLEAVAIAEDGTALANHCCSHESFMRHDMGMDGSTWEHDTYNAHYPNGWELEWVPTNELAAHAGLNAAIAKNAAQAAPPAEAPAEAGQTKKEGEV